MPAFPSTRVTTLPAPRRGRAHPLQPPMIFFPGLRKRAARVQPETSAWHPWIRLTLIASLLGGAWLGFGATVDTQKRRFDLPVDTAEKSLKRFADQSGLQVLYPTKLASNVRTNSLHGLFTPRDALDRILAGTGLIAVHDEKSGALTVLRAPVVEQRPDPTSAMPARAEFARGLVP